MRGSVLIVDNEKTLAALVGDVLGEEGFRVSWLADPRLTAMHTEVARFEPDGVLLDSADAAGYGESWNNATWLHARDRPIAVIMFAAHTRELAEAKLGISERSKGAAFVGFVPKPFDLEELIDVVGRACYVCRGTSEIHENVGTKPYGRVPFHHGNNGRDDQDDGHSA